MLPISTMLIYNQSIKVDVEQILEQPYTIVMIGVFQNSLINILETTIGHVVACGHDILYDFYGHD